MIHRPLQYILFILLLNILAAETNCFAQNVESLKVQAQKYYWGRDVEQDLGRALELYEQAAMKGDAEAQFIAGGMYYTGKGTPVDLLKAYFYLSSAEEQGKSSPDAQQALAEMYINGNVVPQNYLKAQKLFKSAADAGKKEAQNELGFLYYVGRGAERDYNKALRWFEEAAIQGMVMAQYNVGMMWYSGNADSGVDLVKSYAWLSVSAASGHPMASSMVQRVEPMLSQEELNTAQQLSSSIFKKMEQP